MHRYAPLKTRAFRFPHFSLLAFLRSICCIFLALFNSVLAAFFAALCTFSRSVCDAVVRLACFEHFFAATARPTTGAAARAKTPTTGAATTTPNFSRSLLGVQQSLLQKRRCSRCWSDALLPHFQQNSAPHLHVMREHPPFRCIRTLQEGQAIVVRARVSAVFHSCTGCDRDIDELVYDLQDRPGCWRS